MTKRILFFGFLCISVGLAKASEFYIAKSNAYSGTKTVSNVSNWACWIFDNGQSAHSPDGSSGAFYPIGTAAVIYQDGFIWGGKVDTDGDGIGDRIRVGGQQYNIGTVPGWVISGGDVGDAVVADPDDPVVRVYRIRSDYPYMSDSELREDAAIQNEIYYMQVTDEMKQEVLDQYEQDWNEWPVDRGAPYDDKDHDGVYTPGIDEPGIANADQVIWFVVNDYDRTKTTAMLGSEPIGLELQVTIWAYNDKESRFGQSIFKSYKLINKSNSTVEDMYITQWSDPDVGSASDDYVGCDTLLDMGYAYNAYPHDNDYDVYGLVPPAAGYVLLQGPMIESRGDTAVYELNDVTDYKNLPMTSFGWFAAGSALADPELGDYIGSLQYYNMMRGYKPTGDIDDPVPWTLGNVAGAAETKYPLHGDPTVPGESEVDGSDYYFRAGDRRMCVSSGPFDLAPDNCQEIIFALVGGIGEDHKSSVTELKTNAALAKDLYDGKFENVSKATEPPDVICRSFERSVVLEWGSNPDRVAEIENYSVADYKFEGYIVYQFPDSSSGILDGTVIATYDKINGIKIINDTRRLEEYGYAEAEIPVAYGNDRGIQRYAIIEQDHINDRSLYEGSTYYYGVTSYNQNLNENRMGMKMYESPLIIHSVRLQEELPGHKLQSRAGQDDISVQHVSGHGEGFASVKVVDPYAVLADDYRIELDYGRDTSELVFSVLNGDGIILSDNNPMASDIYKNAASPIVDGLEIMVYSPLSGVDSIVQLDAPDGNIVDEQLFYSLNYRGDGSESWHIAAGAPYFTILAPTDNTFGEFNDTIFAEYRNWGDSEIEIVFGDSSIAWSYKDETVLDEKVPFAIYKYNSEGQVRRQFIAVRDDQVNSTEGTWDIGVENDYYTLISYEEIFSYDNSTLGYLESDEQAYLDANDLNALPSRTGYASEGNPFYYPQLTNCRITMFGNTDMPANGTVIRFKSTKPLNIDDSFEFSTVGYEPIQSDSLLHAAIDRINVYPNPYYGYDRILVDDFEEKVTFTHLPAKATIRIFNLAGIHVKTIEHDNANSQFESWYLGNHQNIRIGSGMYIAHIDMPDIGKEKILKFMIVRGGIY